MGDFNNEPVLMLIGLKL